MNPDHWIARWREGRIGFHEGRPNTLLEKHADVLGRNRRVLVPLCGKTEDLAYLASRGHQVVGVELVEDAVVAFFDEHGLTAKRSVEDDFIRYEAPGVVLYAGDFFKSSRAQLPHVDALYDRAALIALPQPLRERYVSHLRTLLPATSPGLVVTFEYPQDKMEGPPFSVVEAELRKLYEGCEVRFLSERPGTNSRLAELGATSAERCFFVQL